MHRSWTDDYLGITVDENGVRAVNTRGKTTGQPLEISELLKLQPRAIAIHGYRWPINEGQPHRELYPTWQPWTPARTLFVAWPSKPSWREAWQAGYWQPYHLAFRRAEALGRVLTPIVYHSRDRTTFIAHSLGTVAAVNAIQRSDGNAVERAVLLNASATSADVLDAATQHPATAFHNIGTHNDLVLRYLGRLFTPGGLTRRLAGYDGVQPKPDNVREIWLHAPIWRQWARETGAQLRASGHWTYTADSHEPLLNALANWPQSRIPTTRQLARSGYI